jgi:glycosyltransferase involved in cell wall biosynthesis
MFVTNSLTGGGAERSINLVCNELVLRNWSVALVPVNKSEPDAIQVKSQIYPLNRAQGNALLGTIRAIIMLNFVARKFKPSVVVLNCDAPEFLGLFLMKRVEIVILQHSSRPWSTRRRLGIFVRKLLSFRTQYFFAVSEHLSIWPDGKSPYRVIQNPLSPNLPKKKFFGAHPLSRIVFIGRMSKEKCPEIPLEISLLSGLPAVMIGDGELQGKLSDRYKKYQLQIDWTGQLRNPWEIINPGDVLIVPSSFEGDGLVVLEGLQRGIPILVSDIPDFRRFNFPEINYCISIEDYHARLIKYSNDLQSLIVPSEIAMKILGRRDIKVLGNEWENVLEEIMKI